jgi:hypothetical protein
MVVKRVVKTRRSGLRVGVSFAAVSPVAERDDVSEGHSQAADCVGTATPIVSRAAASGCTVKKGWSLTLSSPSGGTARTHWSA